uniref:cAMP-regulated phosphoprotein 21 n=1 Tax=Neogobius melanostomus TaxID=47308 RepID=A0A8C6T7P3_9GOBI
MTEVLNSSVVMTSCGVTDRSTPSLCLKNQDERECNKPESFIHCNQVQPKKKVKAKGKLMRSAAVCEESPPVDEILPEANISCSNDNEMSLCKSDDQDKSIDPKKRSLSKEPSAEYTDSTGIDLQQFIVDTLNSNPRERMMLLKLEQEMIDFITSNSPFKKFPHMSSYHRMLVHRVAAYFGMEHNVDQTGKSVIINKTSNTRIPERRFLEDIQEDKREEIHRWKVILKRDSSLDDQTQPRLHPLRERQSKSMEEREEEYQRARDRIFKQCPTVNPESTQETAHTETRAVEEYNPYAETQRRRQLFRGSRDNSGSSWTGSSRQSSFDTDCRYSSDPRPWSSTDSDSSFQWSSPATKPWPTSNNSWDTRSITLFRLPPNGPHSSPPPIVEEQAPNTTYIVENGIPPGSILVNPHTGQPFLNPDGTPAVYNPPDSQQPIRSQPQLQGSAPQQQVLQYSAVSYTAPQMLPVTPAQPYAAIEDLSSQLAHVTVNCQSTSEAPPMYPPNQAYHVYGAPPPPSLPNPPNYCQPSPQMPVYYYGQHPTSAQHSCRPGSPGPHVLSQTAQPTAGYASALGVQKSSAPQTQTVMGSYSPMVSHQCGLVQGGAPLSYPQSKIMGTEGATAASCLHHPTTAPATPHLHQPQRPGLERAVLTMH